MWDAVNSFNFYQIVYMLCPVSLKLDSIMQQKSSNLFDIIIPKSSHNISECRRWTFLKPQTWTHRRHWEVVIRHANLSLIYHTQWDPSTDLPDQSTRSRWRIAWQFVLSGRSARTDLRQRRICWSVCGAFGISYQIFWPWVHVRALAVNSEACYVVNIQCLGKYI